MTITTAELFIFKNLNQFISSPPPFHFWTPLPIIPDTQAHCDMLDKDAFAIEKLCITVITLILHNKTCVKDLSVTQKQKNDKHLSEVLIFFSQTTY